MTKFLSQENLSKKVMETSDSEHEKNPEMEYDNLIK